MLLVLGLCGEPFHKLSMAQGSLECGARQIVLVLGHGELCFAPPIGCFFFVLGALFFEQMLIGNRDGHLRFHLKQLVLHVENDLFQHAFGILSLLYQVVQICAQQRAHPIQ
jgi:hypothetical protein